ncbi:RagB/SusD family nutrient uptake outer membrane protein [Bacteroides sedimenti]|uniref:RagB/SusD domain-containing protein n=1 Tax=Bacteroides sedimenti TaxID=2136147 RepID=A0ABN6ZDD6_9BACE
MKKNILTLLSAVILIITGCNDNVLDRPQLNKLDDANYWVNENNLRLFANGYYTNFLVGYNSGWGTDYAPLRGYNFSDDFVTSNVQPNFESSIPDSRSSSTWMSEYNGPSWYFGWVRKSNLFINRIENVAKPNLTKEAFSHWLGIAKFFKALDYSMLVASFGDVPYYPKSFNETDYAEMYKERTPRGEVMDSVYANFKYALDNVRANDGSQYVNKYVVAGFIARWMLFEGTWQKYHKNDQARAKKYLEFARDAAEIVINSNKYAIASDFRSLFGSEDLSANKECLIYRQYDASQSVTHHVASYSNGNEAQSPAPNLSLVKAFICNDGKVWQNSSVANADSFNLANLIKTRDPRFEATFWNIPKVESVSLLYACKFIDREGTNYVGKTVPAKYGSNTNTNDYPILRYSEVLLNWIEAKAELATLGGSAVTQADIDKSINQIRNRPLDAVAISRGVTKTAPMQLASLPNDPDRDSDVPALIWEIRRERRMEFVFEHSRLLDIKRWKKINYMNCTTHPDNLAGVWVNFPKEVPAYLEKAKIGILKVKNAAGNIITYDGTNASQMVGFYIPEGAKDRNAFDDRVYLSPIGKTQIDLYSAKGYTISQTPLWQ